MTQDRQKGKSSPQSPASAEGMPLSEEVPTAPPPPLIDTPPASFPGPINGSRDSAEPEKKRKKKKKEEKKRKKKAREGEGEGEGTLGSSRGIETMFRTSYQTHNDLSALADNKANIMISINGIIISILIASLAPGLGDSVWTMIPTAVLLIGCLTSMVYAVLAARPRVSRSTVSPEDARSGKANILFFGNFVGVTQEDYLEGMQALMRNTDRAYLNMARDIYALGGVLERKFNLLRVSYMAFTVGLVAGVLLLLITYGFTNTSTL